MKACHETYHSACSKLRCVVELEQISSFEELNKAISAQELSERSFSRYKGYSEELFINDDTDFECSDEAFDDAELMLKEVMGK